MNEAYLEALLRAGLNAHELAQRNGFWGPGTETTMGLTAKLALVTCEVAEIIETLRADPHARSAKVPELSCEAEECADVFLRLMDYCAHRGIDLGRSAALKHEYNKSRPFMHGKKV